MSTYQELLNQKTALDHKIAVAAKYRDPLTGASWSGRGRAPKWIEGKSRADFLV
jgi:DNA-binding protein H-NS